jgi:hypothetical protein
MGTTPDDFDFAVVFEHAPVALWLEDYRDVRDVFARWRAEGVTDLRAFLLEDLSRVGECFDAMQTVCVNRALLHLYELDDVEQLDAHWRALIPESVWPEEADLIVALWEGRTTYSGHISGFTMTGTRMDLLVNFAILPGSEESWEHVVTSVEDISARVVAERALEHLRDRKSVV